jgi:hypothetical protein
MHNPYSGVQYEVPIGYNNYWARSLVLTGLTRLAMAFSAWTQCKQLIEERAWTIDLLRERKVSKNCTARVNASSWDYSAFYCSSC